MEFLDYMIFVFVGMVALGVILGLPCYVIEKLDEKYNWNIAEKIANLFNE